MVERKTFTQNLDQVIEKIDMLKEKSKDLNILGLDDTFTKNIELIINSYKSIKDEVPDELLNRVGKPLEEIIEHMLFQLEDELSGRNLHRQVEDSTINEELDAELKEIDFLLKNPNLGEEEMDSLLDRRIDITRTI